MSKKMNMLSLAIAVAITTGYFLNWGDIVSTTGVLGAAAMALIMLVPTAVFAAAVYKDLKKGK